MAGWWASARFFPAPVCLMPFFFSSRRRHTIYWRDWSSDVCSSDLYGPQNNPGGSAASAHRRRRGVRLASRERSEERRVGKEGINEGRLVGLKKVLSSAGVFDAIRVQDGEVLEDVVSIRRHIIRKRL